MTFEAARNAVVEQLKRVKSSEMMEKKSREILKGIDHADLTTSDYIRLTKPVTLPPLDAQESLHFIQKLFTSSGKKGIISLAKRIVVYKILDQKIAPADANLTLSVQNETDQIKKRVFEEALFKKLNEQFPVKAYVKGL